MHAAVPTCTSDRQTIGGSSLATSTVITYESGGGSGGSGGGLPVVALRSRLLLVRMLQIVRPVTYASTFKSSPHTHAGHVQRYLAMLRQASRYVPQPTAHSPDVIASSEAVRCYRTLFSSSCSAVHLSDFRAVSSLSNETFRACTSLTRIVTPSRHPSLPPHTSCCVHLRGCNRHTWTTWTEQMPETWGKPYVSAYSLLFHSGTLHFPLTRMF